MANAISNPLYGLQAGSTVDEKGRFAATALSPGATKFIAQRSGIMMMTGNSDYAYSDHMNQGSLGVAGGYGVSAVSKLTAAVTAYLGNSHAESAKNLSITLNDIEWAGIEYLDVDDLSVSELIAHLKTNVGHHVETIFDKYMEMQAHLDGSSPESIVAGDEMKKLLDAWQTSVQQFVQNYGTGLVVGVLWGGWGAAKLDFTSANHEDRWKAGGSAEFTYAGTGASVDIAATFGHSHSSIGAGAAVTVEGYFNGDCVRPLVTAWVTDLKQKAAAGLAEIGKESVTRNAALADTVSSPKIPDFVKRKGDPKVADKIGKITSLAGLETYAKAVAYDKYAKGGGNKSLKEFLDEMKQPTDAAAALPVGPVSPFLDDDDDESGSESGGDDIGRAGARIAAFAELEHEPDGPKSGYDLGAFEPIGVWIADWSQFFPWICSAYSNDIPSHGTAQKLVQLKTMHQDFLTLAKLYRRFAATVHVDGGEPDLGGVADSFSHGAASVSAFLAESRTAPSSASITRFIKETLERLGGSAKEIYRIWDRHGFLREGELGLGVVIETWLDGAPVSEKSRKTILKSGGPAPDGGPVHRNSPELVTTEFDEKTGNFSTFSGATKGLPLILPDGRILLYLVFADGRDCGVLRRGLEWPSPLDVVKRIRAERKPPWESWTPHEAREIEFFKEDYADGARSKFQYQAGGGQPRGGMLYLSIDLYPIPYEAARGVDKWLGCSAATGMGTLEQQLDGVREALKGKPKWSLDSDHWTNVDWSDDVYSLRTLRLSYLGLTPDPGNVMPGN